MWCSLWFESLNLTCLQIQCTSKSRGSPLRIILNNTLKKPNGKVWDKVKPHAWTQTSVMHIIYHTFITASWLSRSLVVYLHTSKQLRRQLKLIWIWNDQLQLCDMLIIHCQPQLSWWLQIDSITNMPNNGKNFNVNTADRVIKMLIPINSPITALSADTRILQMRKSG